MFALIRWLRQFTQSPDGLLHAGETSSVTLTEVIRREAYAQSALYFAERLGVRDFVAFKDLTGEQTLTAEFPIYDKVSAAAIAELTDFTTNSALDTSGSVAVTVSEHQIRFEVSDLSVGATVDDIMGTPRASVVSAAVSEGGIAGTAAAEALQRLQDNDLCVLFAGFDTSTGSNSGALTTTLVLAAIQALNINNIPLSPRVSVLHPRQWGNIMPTLDNASVFGAQGQEIVSTGLVGRIWGMSVFETANVTTATVSSSTVLAGTVMHPSAAAIAQKGRLGPLAVQRDESKRVTELNAVGVWGEAEYRGGATTNGRGGAGIYLYSNSTS